MNLDFVEVHIAGRSNREDKQIFHIHAVDTKLEYNIEERKTTIRLQPRSKRKQIFCKTIEILLNRLLPFCFFFELILLRLVTCS